MTDFFFKQTLADSMRAAPTFTPTEEYALGQRQRATVDDFCKVILDKANEGRCINEISFERGFQKHVATLTNDNLRAIKAAAEYAAAITLSHNPTVVMDGPTAGSFLAIRLMAQWELCDRGAEKTRDPVPRDLPFSQKAGDRLQVEPTK